MTPPNNSKNSNVATKGFFFYAMFGGLGSQEMAGVAGMTKITYVVTGSSGRLGGALCEELRSGRLVIDPIVIGIDPIAGPWTTHTPDQVNEVFAGLEMTKVVVFHAGALHKPNQTTHSEQEFLSMNVEFTLKLLQACTKAQEIVAFIYTSTTSVFGDMFVKNAAVQCQWIDETTLPCPKNIYGWSKLATEELIKLYSRRGDLGGETRFAILRACRFFPEEDDREAVGADDGIHDEANLKFTHTLNGRRLSLRDVVGAHLAFLSVKDKFVLLNLGNAVLLTRDDCDKLGRDASCGDLLLDRYGGQSLRDVLSARGWKLPRRVDRVYDASKSFSVLKWQPRDTPLELIRQMHAGETLLW